MELRFYHQKQDRRFPLVCSTQTREKTMRRRKNRALHQTRDANHVMHSLDGLSSAGTKRLANLRTPKNRIRRSRHCPLEIVFHAPNKTTTSMVYTKAN